MTNLSPYTNKGGSLGSSSLRWGPSFFTSADFNEGITVLGDFNYKGVTLSQNIKIEIGSSLNAGSNISIAEEEGIYTITSSHPAITASKSSNNTGRTYIQDLVLDEHGHVTGISTAEETFVNTFRSDKEILDLSKGLLIAGNNITLNKTTSSVTIASTIPLATKSAIGGVQVGDGLAITDAGMLSVPALDGGATKIPTTSLPLATKSAIGAVRVGSGLAITDAGILSVPGFDSTSTTKIPVNSLPLATKLTIGAVRVGSGLDITSDGILSTGAGYSHPNHTGDVTSTGDTKTTISDGAVTAGKIGVGAVTAGKIGVGAVTTEKIEAGAISSEKIEAGAISSEKIEAGAISAEKIEAGTISAELSVSTQRTLADSSGVSRTLALASSGYVAIRVISMASNSPAGFIPGSSSEDGPSPRKVNGGDVDVSAGVNTIKIDKHGLETNTIIRFSGRPPAPIKTGENYQAVYFDQDKIQVKTLAGVTINFSGTPLSSDNFTVSRDTIVSFDALDWYSTSTSGSHYIATVNFKFATVAQGYRWFVRNAGSTKLIILAGDPGSQNTIWSDTTPSHNGFHIGGGRCFEYLTSLMIWGYVGSANYTTPSGGVGKAIGGATDTVPGGGYGGSGGHAALNRARIILFLQSSGDNIPIWFRIFGKVEIQNVIFDYKIAVGSTVPLATAFRCSHGLFSFENIGVIVWDTSLQNGGNNSSNTTAVVALEGGSVYWIAGSHLIQNFSSIGVCSAIGPSKIVVGTPNACGIHYTQTASKSSVHAAVNANYFAFQALTLSSNATLNFNKTFTPPSPSFGSASINSVV